MELDITQFATDADPYMFSASAFEAGQDAGRTTWRNALNEAASMPLLTTQNQLDEAREYFASFGAWERDEIAAWSADEVNALLIQFISGDLRELESLCSDDNGDIDWTKAENLATQGTIGGRIYKGDDGRVYMYIGS